MDFRCFLLILTTFFSYNYGLKAEATFSESPNKLLTKVCDESGDAEFCMQVMRSKPEILTATGMRTVANYALSVVRKQSKITRNFFNGAANKSMNSEENKALKQCATYFNETMGMFNVGGVEDGTASLDVHYALDNSEYCKNALATANVHDVFISDAITRWQKYFSVAYATIVIMEGDDAS